MLQRTIDTSETMIGTTEHEFEHRIIRRDGEERFRKAFDENIIGMVMAGSDCRFVRANAAFCRMFGCTEQELTSPTFKDITHSGHAAHDVLHTEALLNGTILLYRTEKRYVRKDNRRPVQTPLRSFHVLIDVL